MAGPDDADEQQGKGEKQQQQKPLTIPVRRGSRSSFWPWKKTDTSASFLRAARAGNLDKVLEFLKGDTDINTCNSNGLNALHLASKEGHTRVVSALIERGANVDSATKKGNTALHIASLAGQEDIVNVLVEAGAAINTQSQNGFTPLYMAAQENHDSVVRFLLSKGGNQSLATEDGFTPLAVALQQGHDKVVAVLLENDTRGKVRLPALHIAAKKDDSKAAALLLHTDHNPDVTSKSGFTPLHIASHYGNENVASLLLQRGADPNFVAKHQITPLHVSSKWGRGNMVSLLIDKGANIESKTRDGLTPLHCAARSGHETVVDMLLEKGAPLTAKTKNGLAPLHMASQGDHVDAARILLYHKAPVDDVTVDFLTALHVAAHCGHVRVAKLLLDRKADPNSRALNGFTPLHIACKKNRIKVVELLLKHGGSIEATTESGLTPLHVASFMGCMNIVIYLLQNGASPDVPTVRGETPLHLAARASQTDIIRILLRNGAQVDARAREQQTALHIASRLGNTDIVVLLLQHGSAVDANTKDHYTPLHIAAKEGREEVANVLLDHGASLTASTKKGFTPLHLAAKYGNLKVARILLQKDAPVDAQGKNGVTPLHVAAHYDHQNVALLLLDKGASPQAAAKNGYTPLHIAARKNQMDIATTLLEYGASANAESKAGFIPLHLSSQAGHADMCNLLIEHGASCGASARNGLTPLHLCAQEDRVGVAAILVKEGAEVDATTKAGYSPLHVACHFGQMNMVRFLLQHEAQVDPATKLGYTPLHQAAQQGHTLIVNLLLEHKAEPNMETKDGKTALGIAQRLGYISVVETLKVVTETKVTTNTTTVTEEKYKVVVPETMHETTFLSESEDEGGDDTMLGDQSYRFLTVDEMKSLGDDSLPIDEKMDMSFISSTSAAPLQSFPPDHSPQHTKEAPTFIKTHQSDNVDFVKPPIMAGPESLNTTMNTSFNTSMASEEPQIISNEVVLMKQEAPEPVQQESTVAVPVQAAPEPALATVTQPTAESESTDSTGAVTPTPEVLEGWEQSLNALETKMTMASIESIYSLATDFGGSQRGLFGFKRFLVSFMVDARGGAMRGCRHSGVRVIIPPRKAAMPMRITCRYLKKDKLVHAPPLMEGEALSSRILEMGPAGAKFLGPVIIEVPHFASLRGKEREIVILRSDNGETWREHTLEATEEAVQDVLNESFDGEDLKQLEDLNTSRITRILTTDFPQYFAIVTRIRQEVHAIGPEGGMVSSTVVPQVQAVFPQGALTKKIKVGLQAQPISPELVAKLLGNRVAVSPIVTVEPRRRKFHKPITLTIPVPQASSKGMINQYSGEAPTLRLLCSITGGTTRAQWEDVTGSTPLTFVNDCVSFTTTVSARFWLMDCTNIPEATRMATELYREAIHVPFMAKFVVFSKRHQLEEARARVFCMTDDKEDKTLETQEQFIEVAKSRDVEVLEGKMQYLEFAGNIVPITKSGDQLAFNFYAFRENRLPFTIRVKDQNADPIGKILFMRQPKVGRGDPPQSPICNLNLSLPENVQPEPAPSEPDLLSLEKKYAFLSISKANTIHKADLRLTDISNMLSSDWLLLARELDVSESDINIIKSQYPENAPQQGIVMLRLWMQTSSNKASGNTLEKGLRKIGRDDIVQQCIFNVELVTDDIEKAMAKAHLDQSGFDSLKRELGPSADTSLRKDPSLEVSYDEKDLMKEAESAEEDEVSDKVPREPRRKEPPTKGVESAPTPQDLSPTYEREERKYAAEEKIISEEKLSKEESKKMTEEKLSKGEKFPKEDIDLFLIEERISKELKFSKEEKFSSQRKSEERTERIGDEVRITKKEEERAHLEEKSVEQKKEKIEGTKIMQRADVNLIETKMEEKEVYEEKTHGEKLHEERISEERISVAKKSPPPSKPDRPESVTEVIIQEKRTLPTDLGATGVASKDKSELLQKLGEELGKLDDKLEEKFREKSRTHRPVSDGAEVEEEEIVVQPKPAKAVATSHIIVESVDERVREETAKEPSVEEDRSPIDDEIARADKYIVHSPEESVHITDEMASPSSEEVADLPRDKPEQEFGVHDGHPEIEQIVTQDLVPEPALSAPDEETLLSFEVEQVLEHVPASVIKTEQEDSAESKPDLETLTQEADEAVSEHTPEVATELVSEIEPIPVKLPTTPEAEQKDDILIEPFPKPSMPVDELEDEPLIKLQGEEQITEKLEDVKEILLSEASYEQPDSSLTGEAIEDKVPESFAEPSLIATETDFSETPHEAIIEPIILTQPSSEPSSLSTDKDVIFETEREVTESVKETVEDDTARQEPSFESLSSTEIYSPSDSFTDLASQKPVLESGSTEELSQIDTLPAASEPFTQESFEQQYSEHSLEQIIVKEITVPTSDAIETNKQELSSGEFIEETPLPGELMQEPPLPGKLMQEPPLPGELIQEPPLPDELMQEPPRPEPREEPSGQSVKELPKEEPDFEPSKVELDSPKSDKAGEESSSHFQDSQLELATEEEPEAEVLLPAATSQEKEPAAIGISSDDFTQASADTKQMVEEPPHIHAQQGGAPLSDVTHTEQPTATTQPQQQAVDPCLERFSLHCSTPSPGTVPAVKVEDFAASTFSPKIRHKPVHRAKTRRLLRRSNTHDAELYPTPLINIQIHRSKSLDENFPNDELSTIDSRREKSDNDLFRSFGGDDTINFNQNLIISSTALNLIEGNSVPIDEVEKSMKIGDAPLIEPLIERGSNGSNGLAQGKARPASIDPVAVSSDVKPCFLEEEVRGLMAEVAKTKELVRDNVRESKPAISSDKNGLSLQLCQVRDPILDQGRLPTIQEISKESEEEFLSSAEDGDAKDTLENPIRPPENTKPSLDTGQQSESIEKIESPRLNVDNVALESSSSPKKLHPYPILPKKLGVGRWQRILGKHNDQNVHKVEKARRRALDDGRIIPKQPKSVSNKDPIPGRSFSSKGIEPSYHSTSTQTIDLHPFIHNSPHLFCHYMTLGCICREVKDMIAVVEETFHKRSQSRLDIHAMVDRLDVLKESILKANFPADDGKRDPLSQQADKCSHSAISNDLINNNFVNTNIPHQKKMPIGTGNISKEASLLLLSNGQLDVGDSEDDTNVEEALSDGEAPERTSKRRSVPPSHDSGAERTIDVEDVDFSEAVLDMEEVEDVVCTLEALCAPSGEVVHLTEGCAHHSASPLLLDKEGEYQDIEQRHKANILNSNVVDPAEEVVELLTDSEDVETSGGEDLQMSHEEEGLAILQDYYEQNEAMDSKEPPKAKPLMFPKCKKKPASKSLLKKNFLDVHPEEQEDVTEVEDLSGDERKMGLHIKSEHCSHSCANKLQVSLPVASSDPCLRQPQQRRKISFPSDLTDREYLRGSFGSEGNDSYDSSQAKRRIFAQKINQEQDVTYSDACHIEKEKHFEISETQVAQVSLHEDAAKEEGQHAVTDEGGFEMGENEKEHSARPSPSRQIDPTHKQATVLQTKDEEVENESTDIKDMKIEEKNEILHEAICHFPTEDTKVLLCVESQAVECREKSEERAPLLPKKEAILNIPDYLSGAVYEVIDTNVFGPSSEEPLAEISIDLPSHDGTDRDGIEGTDDDIALLPDMKPLSDIRFIHDEGLVSVVILPSSINVSKEDRVEEVIVLDPDNQSSQPDVDCVLENRGKDRPPPKTSHDIQVCSTDDELFEASRPETPLPPESCEATFLSRSKREKVITSTDKDSSQRVTLKEQSEDYAPSSSHDDIPDTDHIKGHPKGEAPRMVIDCPSNTASKQKSSVAAMRSRRRKQRRSKSNGLCPYVNSSNDERVALRKFLSCEEEVSSVMFPESSTHLEQEASPSRPDVENVEPGREDVITPSEKFRSANSATSASRQGQLSHADPVEGSDAAPKPSPSPDSKEEVTLKASLSEAQYPSVTPSSGYNSRSDFASDENIRKQFSGGEASSLSPRTESSSAPGPRATTTKSPLAEAELAAIDCMLASQEATVEEMIFNQKLEEAREEGSSKPRQDATKMHERPSKGHRKPNVLSEAKGKPGSFGLTHSSSEEGDEQLMMRDSPRWEDEEIQAKETHKHIRPIKAEIKLLVKTTELGKESIEIRSIREFQEPGESEEPSPSPHLAMVSGTTESHLASPEPPLVGRTTSPRFVRTSESPAKHDVVDDEFDLMCQVKETKPQPQ